MQESTHYQLLGVTRGASVAEIRRAYRQQALHCHPDHNLNDAGAAARFRQLSEAAAILTEATTRAAYDQRLDAAHRAANSSWAEEGYDVCYTLHITAAEAHAGTTQRLCFHSTNGSPYQVLIVVPAGARAGDRLHIVGAGGPSRTGRRRGDMIATIQIVAAESISGTGSASPRDTAPTRVGVAPLLSMLLTGMLALACVSAIIGALLTAL